VLGVSNAARILPPRATGVHSIAVGEGDAVVRTFLIADIRGYTRFTQEHGDEAAARLASSFADIVGTTVVAHDGELIELRGDEALVVFASARRALRAAVEVQRRFREPGELGPVLPLGVGIGLDSGEAVPLENGGYRGGALNLAARLCSVAKPGEILASEGVVHLARRVDGLRFVPRRAERFKGIAERVRPVEVVPDEPLPPLPQPPTTRRHSSARVGAVAIVLAAAVAAAVLAFLVTRSEGGAAPALAANSAGLLSSDGRVIAQVPIAGRPAGIAVGEGAVWINDSVNGTLLRVDPAKRVVVDRIHVGSHPAGVTSGAGAIWVANSEDGTVSQVNPETDEVVAILRVGNGPTSVAFGAGKVWVLNVIDATLTAITPATGRRTTIPLGQNPTRLAFGLDAVWVTSSEAGVLLRLDPRTKSIVSAIPVGNGPVGVAAGHGAVWVANPPDRTVSRVDPASGSVSKIALPGGPVELAMAGAQLWASNTLDGTVSVIDAGKSHVLRTLTTGGNPTVLAASGSRVWALALASSQSHRGGTLRVVSQGGETFDTIDPGVAYRTATWQMLSMVYDGLVTYRRSGGPSGQEVVPDLATALPVVQDGGRTYVFRLRSGIRYSDGTALKASDVRASLEREFGAGTGISYSVGIVGADQCSKRQCDLSRGIVTDDETGSVTFHLDAPDPDFLFKLALPGGAIVAEGAPPIGGGSRALVGTGPYRIARYVPDRSLVLMRNPHFRQWSSAAQPEGYPDRIVYRFGLDPAASTSAVEQGRADIMLDLPPSDRLREIETQFPSRAHRFVEPTVFYLFLNTRIPPFDDVRVRRAVNFAVDRARLVRLWGGPQLARPTCQVLPPGIAGYRPYCPYTADPSAAGNWKAPHLGRARALIAAAGGARGTVTVHVLDDERLRLGRYFAGVLDRLGFKARLRTYRDVQTFYELAGRPSTRANAGVEGWESNFPRASDFFPGLLACAAYQPKAQVNVNAAGFCDPALDRKIDRARELAATDPAASAALWSRVDREVADAAPWIAFLNRAGIDLTSARVGNYQRHQQFSVLLDQLWVR
jgi:YVTN family beta-propeller protein